MLIEPSGSIRIKCVGDQIHADSQYQSWGLSVPQASVEPEQLNEACFKVARACKARGIVGYFTVDFITFIHPKTVPLPLLLSLKIFHYFFLYVALGHSASLDDSVAMSGNSVTYLSVQRR